MVRAEYDLSGAYRAGCGVPQDSAAANAHLLKAAEGGEASAQYDLAGRNFLENRYVEAAEWYRKAALQGRPETEMMLGKLYEDGDGVSQDYVKAAEWYRKAAEHSSEFPGGDALGKNDLGLLYLDGKGVPKDNVEAYKWFALAGIDRNLCIAASEMTAEEIREAKQRVAEWRQRKADPSRTSSARDDKTSSARDDTSSSACENKASAPPQQPPN